jgi:hypothetical protein
VAAPVPVAPPVAAAPVAPAPYVPSYEDDSPIPDLSPPYRDERPDLNLPPSPFGNRERPAPVRPASTPAPEVEAAPVAQVAAVGGFKPLPPAAWDRVKEFVRSKSVPTAALLDQQAAIDRWEAEGAVVVRIAKGCRDMFEKQAAKKKVLGEAIQHVFGPGTYPKLEIGDPKAPPPAGMPTAARSSPPPEQAPRTGPMSASPAPSAMAPAPVAPPPAAPAPKPAPFDDIPSDDAPPAWLDELEDSRPEPEGARAVAAVAAVPRPEASSSAVPSGPPPSPTPASGEPVADDHAIKLTTDLFNGRLIPPTDGLQA